MSGKAAFRSDDALQPVINEFLAHPATDWNGDGNVSSSDEYIELYNPAATSWDISNWKLDDAPQGTTPYTIPENTILPPGGLFVFFRRFGLNNAGDTVRLLQSNETLVDSFTYSTDPGNDVPWSRIPDGGTWSLLAAPSPGETNPAPALPTSTHTPTSFSSATASPSHTATSTPTPTHTATPFPTSTLTPTQVKLHSVLINEIAWAGTDASANDEWIELYNATGQEISLEGWHLRASDSVPDIVLSGQIQGGGFYLLERTNDSTISDLAADLIYSGALSNQGETLILFGPSGEVVDTANISGGEWPAGNAAGHISMERLLAAPDEVTGWHDNDGIHINGLDANGNPIQGSPKSGNSVWIPTSTPTVTLQPTPSLTATTTPSPTITATPTASPSHTTTSTPTPTTATTPSPTITVTSTASPSHTATITPTPTHTATPFPTPTLTPTQVKLHSVLINEIAWAGTDASANDEWIELYNATGQEVSLEGWRLRASDGSPDIALSGQIQGGGFYLLERTDDSTISDLAADLIYSGALSNQGETLILFGPSGEVVDTANIGGGEWPAGNAAGHISMERLLAAPDEVTGWHDNDGIHINGLDANGNPIQSSPKKPNSVWLTPPQQTNTPTPTPMPVELPTPPQKTSPKSHHQFFMRQFVFYL